MVYLDIAGRCGNQMFQYAFARKLSIINHDEITIDFSLMDVYAKRHNDPTFRDELYSFEASNHYEKIVDGSNKIYRYGSKEQVYVFKVYTKIKRFLQKYFKDKRLANKLLYRVMCHYGIYWYMAPKKLRKTRQKNKFVFGYFEDPAFFDDIRDTLVQELVPKYQPDPKNSELLKMIHTGHSVCVSFRKWETTGGTNVALREVCDEKYYHNAIDFLNKKIPDALFVIFSNDVEWVKANFAFPDHCIFESGDDPIYEKVRLMSACKHFVLSNSTFAWWVQYLGQAENKIVIAPDRWSNDEKKRNPLIMPSFTIIS